MGVTAFCESIQYRTANRCLATGDALEIPQRDVPVDQNIFGSCAAASGELRSGETEMCPPAG